MRIVLQFHSKKRTLYKIFECELLINTTFPTIDYQSEQTVAVNGQMQLFYDQFYCFNIVQFTNGIFLDGISWSSITVDWS